MIYIKLVKHYCTQYIKEENIIRNILSYILKTSLSYGPQKRLYFKEL